jgi:hypothetical protein
LAAASAPMPRSSADGNDGVVKKVKRKANRTASVRLFVCLFVVVVVVVIDMCGCFAGVVACDGVGGSSLSSCQSSLIEMSIVYL